MKKLLLTLLIATATVTRAAQPLTGAYLTNDADAKAFKWNNLGGIGFSDGAAIRSILFGGTHGVIVGGSGSKMIFFDGTTPIVKPSGSLLTGIAALHLMATPSINFSELTGSISTSQIPNTAVTPGSYTNTNLTVDQQGRITAASNGTGGGSGGTGTVTSVTMSGGSTGLTFSPGTPLTSAGTFTLGGSLGWASLNKSGSSIADIASHGFSDLTGSVTGSQMPAFIGDITNPAGSLTTTIATNAVTNAKAAQMAANTIKGNNVGSTGNAIDLSITQAKTMLSLTGTNSGDQFVFKTIAVDGQSDVVADSATDKLTLAAGSNITLTTDASSDTVTISAGGSTMYISPTGDDVNDGLSSSTPKATIDAAAIAIGGLGNIILLQGTYTNISLTPANAKSLTISGEAGKKVTVRFGEALTSFTNDSGIRWKSALSHAPDSTLAYVFKLNEGEGLISDAERHPLNRGATYRLPHKRLVHASSKADVLSGNGRWWYESGFLYLSAPDGGNPNGSTYQVPAWDPGACFINSAEGGNIIVKGINVEFAYRGFDLHSSQSYQFDSCSSFGSTDCGFYIFDVGGAGSMTLCESAASSNDGIVVGSLYLTISSSIARTTEANLNAVYVHDNYDKGLVAHERGTVFVNGGLYEHQENGSGLLSFDGGEISAVGTLTRHNLYGLWSVGPVDAAEGGIGSVMNAISCVSVNDDYSWWAEGTQGILTVNKCSLRDANISPMFVPSPGILTSNECTFYMAPGQNMYSGAPTVTGALVLTTATPVGNIGAPTGVQCINTTTGITYYKSAGDVSDNTSWTTYLTPASISDTAYDSSSWNSVTTIAPSKNAVRDKFESLAASAFTDTTAPTYITETATSSLSNEFAMGSLATGLVKNTTTTGVPSIATPGTDYVVPSGVISSALTGYTSGAGAVSASDTILGAIQKLNGNDALKAAKGANTDITSIGAITKIFPASNGTTAIQFTKADGSTVIGTIDTTNSFFGIGNTPRARLEIKGNAQADGHNSAMIIGDSAGQANSRDWALGNATDAYGNLYLIFGASADADPVGNVGSGGRWIFYRGGGMVIGPYNTAAPGADNLTVTGIIKTESLVAAGTATSCTGATIGSGSKNNAGSFTATTTGTSTIVVTFSVTAPTGWNIFAVNTATGVAIQQTSSSTTTATLSGTTASGNVIRYLAFPY